MASSPVGIVVDHQESDALFAWQGRRRRRVRFRAAQRGSQMHGRQRGLRLGGELARVLKKVHVSRHLGLEDLGREGFDQVIHRAQGVAARHVDLVHKAGGGEDDGRLGGALDGPEPGGGFEAVHDRHLDVEQDDNEIVGLGQAQGFGAGTG